MRTTRRLWPALLILTAVSLPLDAEYLCWSPSERKGLKGPNAGMPDHLSYAPPTTPIKRSFVITSRFFPGALTATLVTLLGSPLLAQDLHVFNEEQNDRWSECSFILDPSLTQDAWHQFTGEVALVIYFRPLSSARPLGVRNFEVAVLDWATKIDEFDSAWNETFAHPDSAHLLADGDLLFPGLMARAGVTELIDVGAYFTKNPSANYGFVGAQVQYSFLDDPERNLAAALRLNYVRMFGPEDLNASVVGIDVLASREYSRFSPYAGVSGYLGRAQETTSKVDLKDENVLGLQGMIGVATNPIAALKVSGEFNMAKVAGYSIKIGYGF